MLVGLGFVGEHRLSQAEEELDEKVVKTTHIAEHNTDELRIAHVEQAVEEIQAQADRIETYNAQRQTIHEKQFSAILDKLE